MGNQTLAQATQIGCGIFILGDIKNLAIAGPEEPALAEFALSKVFYR